MARLRYMLKGIPLWQKAAVLAGLLFVPAINFVLGAIVTFGVLCALWYERVPPWMLWRRIVWDHPLVLAAIVITGGLICAVGLGRVVDYGWRRGLGLRQPPPKGKRFLHRAARWRGKEDREETR